MQQVQQQTQLSNENAARDAWENFLTSHPRIQKAFNIAGSFLGFFFNGYIIVAFVQWLVTVAGRIAESALLLATLYVTLNNVAHTLVTWVLPAPAISLGNYLSVVAFSLLPELIVASAITVTINHWLLFFKNRSFQNSAWVWATLYTLPTIAFIVMTVTTLSSFVQIQAVSGTSLQATGAALTFRFLAGWFYSMIEILFNRLGKKSYAAMFGNLSAIIAELRATVAVKDGDIKNLGAMVDARDSTLDGLRATVAEKEQELQELRATIERATRPRALKRSTFTGIESATPIPQEGTTQSTMEGGYVAVDDGDNIAITDGGGATILATGEPRERIKAALQQAMLSGEKVNLKKVADIAQAGYSTVRKHAPAIIEEIAQELPAITHKSTFVERDTDKVAVV